MSTAKKAVYAAVGASEAALAHAKNLPKRALEIPGILAGSSKRLGDAPQRVAGLPKAAAAKATQVLKGAAGRMRSLTSASTSKAGSAFEEYATRGEKLVRQIRPAKPDAKKVAKPAKITKPKVKAVAATNGASDSSEPVVVAQTSV